MFPVRKHQAIAIASVIVLLSVTSSSLACLWDYDTLRDERRGLPGIAEILAGKWEKHSQFFYEQRVQKMKALIEKEPNNIPAFDNLAVAYEKLGDRDSAIAIMDRKEKIKPGEYTTYANAGTFYLHKGDLDNGIEYIRKALQINPDAHFGREEYQLRLAEFLREGKSHFTLLRGADFLLIRDGKILTPEEVRGLAETGLSGMNYLMHEATSQAATTQTAAAEPADPDAVYADPDFAGEIVRWAYRGSPAALKEMGLKDNVFDGIVGMIRFGTGTSAELYLTLGDLLVLRGDKNLAYRAYQRALDLNHPRQAYLKAVMNQLSEMIFDKTSIQPEAIAAERANADAWVNAYQNYEDQLLRDGKNVDDEASYAAFYAKFGPAKLPQPFRFSDYWNPKHYDVIAPAILTLLVVVPVSVFVALRRAAKRRLKAKLGAAT